jgi:hypothetical protein
MSSIYWHRSRLFRNRDILCWCNGLSRCHLGMAIDIVRVFLRLQTRRDRKVRRFKLYTVRK